MAEVVDRIVDRRRRQEENLLCATSLLMEIVLKEAITRCFPLAFALDTWISEVMSLVDDYNIRITESPTHITRPPASSLKVSVIVCDEADKSAVEIGKEILDQGFPHVFTGGLRGEQHHALGLM
jgi:hypothetical protein